MQENTTFTVYTRKLAYELRLRGFKIIGILPDRTKPYYDNYVFINSPELQKAIREINTNRDN